MLSMHSHNIEKMNLQITGIHRGIIKELFLYNIAVILTSFHLVHDVSKILVDKGLGPVGQQERR